MPAEPTSKPPKFIYWFAYHNLDMPSVRYRAQYPLDFLQKHHGIESQLVIPSYRPAKIWRFLKAYFSALFFPKPASVVVVQRVHSQFIYANLLRFLVRFTKAPTVYDLDDADYLEQHGKSLFYFIKNCKMLWVGSHELAKNLEHYNPNIFVNTSPTPDLKISKNYKNPVLNLGWVGCFGGGHKQSLVEQFFSALAELDFRVKLTLLGVERAEEQLFLSRYFAPFKNVKLRMPQNIDWRSEQEVQQHIARFDVGIATLLDDELHRSKSAFKLKQCLNCGVPVLSANLPENNRFLQDGINGFLCSSPAQFRQRIVDFQSMSQADYARMQEAARQSISQFDLKAYCQKMAYQLDSGRPAKLEKSTPVPQTLAEESGVTI